MQPAYRPSRENGNPESAAFWYISGFPFSREGRLYMELPGAFPPPTIGKRERIEYHSLQGIST